MWKTDPLARQHPTLELADPPRALSQLPIENFMALSDR
jgi:hypothetical protein